MNLTLRQLHAFVAVAETGSFTGAAQRLHLTQSALSVLVRELERELAVRLFDRSTRRVQLSEAGRDLQPQVRRMLEQLQDAVASVGKLRDKKKGVLRIGAPQLMASTLMPPLIAAYAAEFPGVDVRLFDTLPEQMFDGLQAGEVELAIGPDGAAPAAGAGNAELRRQPLLRDRHWLVCPADHALAQRPRVQWRELQRWPFIAPTRDFMQRLQPELAKTAGHPHIVPAHEVSYMTTALGLVAAGLGLTACPSYAAPLARAQGLVMRPLVAPVFYREVCAFSVAARGLSPAAESFMAFLPAQVQALDAAMRR
jgi:DNA-binding transcriptional LysR family regulator